ncbi:unnamed protein product [Ilex paraguariensis]|uniref:Uncharacterized protein n=1 Tax=Ilex paraguariensis TaxID=185542 RepID=A0ABC8TBI5_9AQUA
MEAVNGSHGNDYENVTRLLCLYILVIIFLCTSGHTIAWAYTTCILKHANEKGDRDRNEGVTAAKGNEKDNLEFKRVDVTVTEGLCIQDATEYQQKLHNVENVIEGMMGNIDPIITIGVVVADEFMQERRKINELIEPKGAFFDAISYENSFEHIKMMSTQTEPTEDCGHQNEINNY